MKKIEVKIDVRLAGMRLDVALVDADIGMSRRKIRRIIDVGGAYVNGKRVRIASRELAKGDTVRLEFNPESVTKKPLAKFTMKEDDILYEDDGLLVLCKPPGLPSQATRDQAIVHVVPAVTKLLTSLGRKKENLILVHRLDKETTGVMILAKNKVVATHLTDAFRERVVRKEYHAICVGHPKEKKFSVECHLSSIQSKAGIVKKVRSGGKYSYTDFVVEGVFRRYGTCLVHCFPKTGRSHQLRVHLDSVGLPILGDKKYGGRLGAIELPEEAKEAAGLHHMLHCKKMSFSPAPGAKEISVEAPYPEGFNKCLEELS